MEASPCLLLANALKVRVQNDLASLTLPDLVGALISFTFTIIVFSYILGDNPLFRLVIHIFIGVAAGFAAGMIFYNVILNQLIFPLIEKPAATFLFVVPPLLLGIWLLSKIFPGLRRFGNPVVAYLVGVGAATAIGGAVLGTIFPQIGASASLFDLQTISPAVRISGSPWGEAS